MRVLVVILTFALGVMASNQFINLEELSSGLSIVGVLTGTILGSAGWLVYSVRIRKRLAELMEGIDTFESKWSGTLTHQVRADFVLTVLGPLNNLIDAVADFLHKAKFRRLSDRLRSLLL